MKIDIGRGFKESRINSAFELVQKYTYSKILYDPSEVGVIQPLFSKNKYCLGDEEANLLLGTIQEVFRIYVDQECSPNGYKNYSLLLLIMEAYNMIAGGYVLMKDGTLRQAQTWNGCVSERETDVYVLDMYEKIVLIKKKVV